MIINKYSLIGVNKMFKNMTDLKEILSSINIKCHGEEILKIINE